MRGAFRHRRRAACGNEPCGIRFHPSDHAPLTSGQSRNRESPRPFVRVAHVMDRQGPRCRLGEQGLKATEPPGVVMVASPSVEHRPDASRRAPLAPASGKRVPTAAIASSSRLKPELHSAGCDDDPVVVANALATQNQASRGLGFPNDR